MRRWPRSARCAVTARAPPAWSTLTTPNRSEGATPAATSSSGAREEMPASASTTLTRGAIATTASTAWESKEDSACAIAVATCPSTSSASVARTEVTFTANPAPRAASSTDMSVDVGPNLAEPEVMTPSRPDLAVTRALASRLGR